MTTLEVISKDRKRSPIGAPARRTTALMVRLTEVQRRAFEERAALSGLSTSAWARMVLLRELREKQK